MTDSGAALQRRLVRWWEIARTQVRALHPVRFDLLLGIGALLGLLTGQGQDILLQLVQGNSPVDVRWWFLVACAGFGVWIWWHARVVYQLDFGENPITRPTEARWLKLWLPRLLGTSVAALPAGMALALAWGEPTSTALLIVSIAVLAALVFRRAVLRHASWREVLTGATSEGTKQSIAIDVSGLSAREIVVVLWKQQTGFVVTWGLLLAASPIMLVVVAVGGGDLGWSPGTVVMIGLALISAIGSAIALASDTWKLPLVRIVVLWMVISGLLIPSGTLPPAVSPDLDGVVVRQPGGLRDVLSQWHDQVTHGAAAPETTIEHAPGAADASADEPSRPQGKDRGASEVERTPLVLASASGGGIRAAYWTATVLAELGCLSPDRFERHLFAASGVSGGSLGLVAYRLALDGEAAAAGAALGCGTDAVGVGRQDVPRVAKLQAALGRDLLSSALAAMLFQDLAGRALPILGRGQRGEALERAWHRAFDTVPAADASRHLHDGRRAHRGATPPFLLLNATELGGGRRLILHDLPLQDSMGFGDIFTQALDGQCLLPRASLVQAAHHSARFPYLSPVGVLGVRDPDATKPVCGVPPEVFPLRFGDGGYFDNSGMTTTIELLAALQRAAAANNVHVSAAPAEQVHAVPIRPVLLSIENDPNSDVEARASAWFNIAPGLTDPLLGVVSTRERRGRMGADFARNVSADDGSNAGSPGPEVFSFRLYRHFGDEAVVPLPLGWYLSRPAACAIRRQFCHSANQTEALRLFQLLGDRDAIDRLGQRCERILAQTQDRCTRVKPGEVEPS